MSAAAAVSSDPAIQYSFPASQALQLVALVRRWEVDPELLLAPFGLELTQLEQPDARLGVDTVVGLTERARELTAEPGLGIYLGLQKHISSYGFVGFAAMSAATMREALQLAVELTPTLTTSFTLTLREEGDAAALVVHQHADLASVQDVVSLSFFVGLRQITRDLTGRDDFGAVELVIPEPPYFHRFDQVLPGVRFGQPIDQLVFPRAGLEIPLTRPNRATLNLARQHCLAELERLGFDASLPARTRRMMAADEGFASLERLAGMQGVSPRTLKRRLAEHGVSYSQILREERQVRASHLLRATNLTLDEIATRLGYATTSNFSRAFQRWTGHSPAVHRREQRAHAVLGRRGADPAQST